MKRSYVLLGIAVLAGALIVAATARPRRAAVTPAAATAGARVERTLSITIVHGAVDPARIALPKGARVTIRVSNRDAIGRRLSLLGYEGAFAPVTIPPGGDVAVRFAADHPGSDFAWLVDGNPAGLFVVQGSHLVEGHR
jgi:hypothetical protein